MRYPVASRTGTATGPTLAVCEVNTLSSASGGASAGGRALFALLRFNFGTSLRFAATLFRMRSRELPGFIGPLLLIKLVRLGKPTPVFK